MSLFIFLNYLILEKLGGYVCVLKFDFFNVKVVFRRVLVLIELNLFVIVCGDLERVIVIDFCNK